MSNTASIGGEASGVDKFAGLRSLGVNPDIQSIDLEVSDSVSKIIFTPGKSPLTPEDDGTDHSGALYSHQEHPEFGLSGIGDYSNMSSLKDKPVTFEEILAEHQEWHSGKNSPLSMND
ncbi:hypothetical protein A9Q91_02465 [Candidatus Gracilibacteria bacterium 28_42_T64]|nr:hypothetical protein A9Q91_02465 [Candidatus Gracilibacteria bacterium 28_42_T64]